MTVVAKKIEKDYNFKVDILQKLINFIEII